MEDEDYSGKKYDDINELLELDESDEDEVVEGLIDFLLNFDDDEAKLLDDEGAEDEE